MTILKRLLLLLFGGVLIFGFHTSCGDGGEEPPDAGWDEDKPQPQPIPNNGPIPAPTSLNCPSGTSLNYENYGEAFLLQYCTSCHSADVPEALRAGAPETCNLDTPSDAMLWRTAILAKTVTEEEMPPSGHISEDVLEQLAEWLECGAPSGEERLSSD